jgi:2-oxoglutarate ferredoxin oxidoreductase subunit alpha
MNEKVLMKGNEAFGEAAILAGCRFYFGYPITPQSEIPEYLSRELPQRNGCFIQAESELAAINMAYGAGCAGGSVFISSSSPGIALMQEGLSFLCCAEVPAVVLNVSRCGPGVGGIQPGQSDYTQATRGGGNGDYRIPVFAPANIQEAIDMIYQAPLLADRWRNPVMILSDGLMGQMMEPVYLPEQRSQLFSADVAEHKPWALTGKAAKGGCRSVIKALYLQPEDLEVQVEKIFDKYAEMEAELPSVEYENLAGADLVFVAYGTMSRLIKEVVEILAQQGIKAGLIRPISLWPFAYDVFDRLDFTSTKAVFAAELSKGQMIEDVKIGLKGRLPLDLVYRTGGIIPTSLELAQQALKLWEVYK